MMISNYNLYSPCNTNLVSFNQYTNNLEQKQHQQQKIDFTTDKHKFSNNHSNNSFIHNIQSFNLDTHLDMNRYMYLADNQNIKNLTNASNSSSNPRLESCLAVDCNLESYSSLSSSSSTSSSTTSLSSSSIATNQQQTSSLTQPSTLSTNGTVTIEDIVKIKSSNLNKLNKAKLLLAKTNIKTNTNLLNSPFTSSSECLSSDEGYVGSYSDSNYNNKKIQNQRATLNYYHQQQTPLLLVNNEVTTNNDITARASLHQQINKLLSPEDQLKLLKFLLNQQFLKQQLQLQDQQQHQQQQQDQNFTHECEQDEMNDLIRGKDAIEDDDLNLKVSDLIEPLFNKYKNDAAADFKNSLLYRNEPNELALNWCEAKLGNCFDIANKLLEVDNKVIKKNYIKDTEMTTICECHLNNSDFNGIYSNCYENDYYLNELFSFIWTNVSDEFKNVQENYSSMIGYSKCYKCIFRINQIEAHSLLKDLNTIKLERERMEEHEMYSRNWRFILERKQSLEAKMHEFNLEDMIDLNAYLNEIDMNLDYYHYDDIKNDSLLIDDLMLKFKTNKMAFNLRLYHNYLLSQKELLKVKNNNDLTKMFANLHVDSIPEFIPVPANIDSGDLTSDLANIIENVSENYGSERMGDNDGGEDVNYQLINDHEYLIIDKQISMTTNNLTNDLNNEMSFIGEEQQFEMDTTIICNDNNGTIIEDSNYYNECELIEHDGGVVNADGELIGDYYYDPMNNFEDYEDYEDQMYIDSLSEEEALALLRNESELYALQMAQASKSGILNDPSLKLNPVENCSSLNDDPSSQIWTKEDVGEIKSSDSNNNNNTNNNNINDDVPPSTQLTNGNEDIFENVFNYYETQSLDKQQQQPNVDANEEYVCNDTYGLIETQTTISSDLISNQSSYCSSSTISLSLRNSLLKLRHSRRHLAALLELNTQKTKSESNGSTATSSTTSSLTTSNMSLYKQHMLNIQTSSRKPCAYMLNEGRCARADCRFVHDLKTITCKYWMEGECLKGENCEFLHDYVEVEQIETPPNRIHHHRSSFSSSYSGSSGYHGKKNKNSTHEPVVVKKDFKLDSEEFPALGLNTAKTTTEATSNTQTTTNNKTKSPGPASTPVSNLASVLKQQQQPVKTAASVLLSNVNKSQPSKAVNIVQNKKQLTQNVSSSVSSTASTATNSKKKAKKTKESMETTNKISLDKKSNKQTTGANTNTNNSGNNKKSSTNDDLNCNGHKSRDQQIKKESKQQQQPQQTPVQLKLVNKNTNNASNNVLKPNNNKTNKDNNINRTSCRSSSRGNSIIRNKK